MSLSRSILPCSGAALSCSFLFRRIIFPASALSMLQVLKCVCARTRKEEKSSATHSLEIIELSNVYKMKTKKKSGPARYSVDV